MKPLSVEMACLLGIQNEMQAVWVIMVAYAPQCYVQIGDFDSLIPEWSSLYFLAFFKWLLMYRILMIQVIFIFWKLDVGWFYHFG